MYKKLISLSIIFLQLVSTTNTISATSSIKNESDTHIIKSLGRGIKKVGSERPSRELSEVSQESTHQTENTFEHNGITYRINHRLDKEIYVSEGVFQPRREVYFVLELEIENSTDNALPASTDFAISLAGVEILPTNLIGLSLGEITPIPDNSMIQGEIHFDVDSVTALSKDLKVLFYPSTIDYYANEHFFEFNPNH